jgi:IclR family pca regulon transcriptional regulator
MTKSTMQSNEPDSPEVPEEREPTIAEQIDALTDPSFMTSLARGLAVVQAFSDSRKPQTIAQISQKTGIPRAAVRRCLFTLQQLGYVDAELNNFSLRPKVLTLGYSYLSSTPLTVSSQPYLNGISRAAGRILFAGRARRRRSAVRGALGRLARDVGGAQHRQPPAGLLHLARPRDAGAPGARRAGRLFRKSQTAPMTDKTVTSQKRLREILLQVRQDGYAINDEELELGLRSIAVPVRGASGQVLAALNVGAQASRVSADRMREEFLPVLLRGAQELAVLLP